MCCFARRTAATRWNVVGPVASIDSSIQGYNRAMRFSRWLLLFSGPAGRSWRSTLTPACSSRARATCCGRGCSPDAVAALAATMPDDPRLIEQRVLDDVVPYAYDWQTAGVPWYFPTTEQALRAGSGDCESRAARPRQHPRREAHPLRPAGLVRPHLGRLSGQAAERARERRCGAGGPEGRQVLPALAEPAELRRRSGAHRRRSTGRRCPRAAVCCCSRASVSIPFWNVLARPRCGLASRPPRAPRILLPVLLRGGTAERRTVLMTATGSRTNAASIAMRSAKNAPTAK